MLFTRASCQQSNCDSAALLHNLWSLKLLTAVDAVAAHAKASSLYGM
jgi:hypothetical protein